MTGPEAFVENSDECRLCPDPRGRRYIPQE